MSQKLIPYLVMAALSGCSVINQEQHQVQQQQMQTLTNKINALEESVGAQIAALQVDIATQSQQQVEQFQLVEHALKQLKNQTTQLQTESLEQFSVLQEAKQAVDSLPQEPVMASEESLILGEIERVYIESVQQSFAARLDTGAATSSINALNIEQFERDGKEWVRFYIINATDQSGASVLQGLVETPIFRFAQIRQSSSDETERRPVVELWVKLGKLHEKVQFTLADRSHMEFPVLIGREFIKDIAIIDVSKKYTQSHLEQAQ